jgi:hypothetical protein
MPHARYATPFSSEKGMIYMKILMTTGCCVCSFPYIIHVIVKRNEDIDHINHSFFRWKWSCIPSLLYCISRKNVDTEYMYYFEHVVGFKENLQSYKLNRHLSFISFFSLFQ